MDKNLIKKGGIASAVIVILAAALGISNGTIGMPGSNDVPPAENTTVVEETAEESIDFGEVEQMAEAAIAEAEAEETEETETEAAVSEAEETVETDAAESEETVEAQDDTDKAQDAQTEERVEKNKDSKKSTKSDKEESAKKAEKAEEAYYEFSSYRKLSEHFEKHGDEFGYANEQEYLDGANRVINDPNSLHKIEAEDGDYVFYLEETNEFVIVARKGFIRTYYKPSGGIDYFNRQ